MQTITKPTVRTTDRATMRAIQQAHQYETAPVLAQPDVWNVQNTANGETYRVDLRTGACTCPHARRINAAGETCKHFELVNLILLTGQNRPQAEPVLTPAQRIQDEAEWRADYARRRRALYGPDDL